MKVERERRGAPCYRGILLCHDIVRYVGQFIPCYTLPLAMPCVPISCCVGRLGTSRGMGNLRMKTAAEPGTLIAVGMYASHCISYLYWWATKTPCEAIRILNAMGTMGNTPPIILL